MRTHSILIAVLMSLAVLSSCCPMLSVHPISAPSAVEPRLAGVWKLDSDKDEQVFLHITEVPENRMVVLMVEHQAGKKLDVQQVPFHLSKLKSGLYINIDAAELPSDEFKDKPGYLFFRIDLNEPDRLGTAMLDEKPIIAAIKGGELKGRLTYKKRPAGGDQANDPQPGSRKIVECVTITDSSENIRKFLETRDNGPLFTDHLSWVRMD